MGNKKIYISAPISGYNLTERKAFFSQIEGRLAEEGYKPVNPFNNALPDSAPYTEHLKQDIKLLLDCDGMVRPSRWRKSKGCEIEARVAKACGIPTIGIIEDDGTLNIL